MSAVVRYCPFILVRINLFSSTGQLHLDSSVCELRSLVSRKKLYESPLARIMTGFPNVFPFGSSSFKIGEIISCCA